MKKIISLLSAAALMATSLVATTVASAAGEKPTLRYVVKYDDAVTPYEAGKTGSIEFYCDNLELINMDNMDAYLSGVDTVGITCTLDTAYLTSTKLKLSSPALSNSTRNYNAGKCTVQWGTTDFDAMVYDMSKSLFTIKFTIAQTLTSAVEIPLEGCNIRLGQYDADGALVANPYYLQSSDTLAVPKLTVGPAAPKTYAVTLTDATSDYAGNLNAVPENTEITVTATEKTGFTATLKKDGVAVTSPYKFTVTADTTFTVDYAEIVQENIHKYTLDDKGTCTKDTTKGIYYSLSVKNVANKLAIKVSGKTFEIPANIPEVTGDTKAQLTYVILGVPADMTAAPDLEAVTSGETVFEAE